MERDFFIICLKRSQFVDSGVSEYTSDWFKQCDIVYWRANRQGYTSKQEEAGRYTLEELEHCNGAYLDWFVVPARRRLN